MDKVFSKDFVENQRKISRLAITVGQLLQQHGAESALVVDITRRLGLALGAEEVEVSLTASAMVVTTIINDYCKTTTRQCIDRGINMQVITEVQRICIHCERGDYDMDEVEARLANIKPMRYNRWLVAVMVAFSCASFSHLSGGGFSVFCLTFVASFLGMIVRQQVGKQHFNPLVNFAITAFFTTSIVSIGVLLHLVGQADISIAMGSSVLMLVPGFPLINAVSDMVKGYVNLGIARWTVATLLTLATSLGIVCSMSLFKIVGW